MRQKLNKQKKNKTKPFFQESADTNNAINTAKLNYVWEPCYKRMPD